MAKEGSGKDSDVPDEEILESVADEPDEEPKTPMADRIRALAQQVHSWPDAMKVADGDLKMASDLWRKVKAWRQTHADEIKATGSKATATGKVPKMSVERKLRGALPMKGKVDDRLVAVYNYYREHEGYDGSLEDFMNDFPIHAAKELDGVQPAIIKSTVSDKTIFSVSKTGAGRNRADGDTAASKAAEALEMLDGDPSQQVLEVKLEGHKLDQELQRLKIEKMRGEIEGSKAGPPDSEEKVEVPVEMGDGKMVMMKVSPMQFWMMEMSRARGTDAKTNPVIETTGFLKDVGLIGGNEGSSDEMRELRAELRDT